MEEWRPVLGYEGIYEASDLGRIRSVDRTVVIATVVNLPHVRQHVGRLLRLTKNAHGYRCVTLSKVGVHKLRTVHSIVLQAFVGPPPDGMVGCHNNGTPGDNRLSNLRYDTMAGNRADQWRHGGYGNSKITEADVRTIRSAPRIRGQVAALARALKITTVQVRAVRDRRCWKHVIP